LNRIIAGIHRGRRLAIPDGQSVRPTTDRMRERVFSMLNHPRYANMRGARVADIFAGTGALGLEALSRGAEHITFVEKAMLSITALKTNIETLKAKDATKILKLDATKLPKPDAPYEFIFMDPPYRKGLVEPTLESILEKNWLAADGAIICELATDESLAFPNELALIDERKQGQQRIIFLSFNSNS